MGGAREIAGRWRWPLVMRAAQEGIELERVEVTVSSQSDHRGLLGLDGVSAAPLGLRVR